MPLAATWMDPEIIILSEVSQRKTNIIWHHLYVESQKNDTNELIYKTEIDSPTKKRNFWLLKGKCWGEGINWKFGIDIRTLLYLNR